MKGTKGEFPSQEGNTKREEEKEIFKFVGCSKPIRALSFTQRVQRIHQMYKSNKA